MDPLFLMAFLAGAVSFISSCIGPALYSVLAYAAAGASASSGMLLLLVFSLGLGIPFILTSLFLGAALEYLDIAKKRYEQLRLWRKTTSWYMHRLSSA